MSPTSSHHLSERENILPGLTRGAVWLAVQLLPLSLLLLHAPLWARSPRPQEQFAPSALVGVQLFASALLFPWLLDRRGSIVFVIGTAVMFDLLATIAAEQTLTRWMICSIVVAVWLLGLALAARFVRSRLMLALGSSILAGAAPLIAYFMAT